MAEDAKHFRDEAARCLEVARRISDRAVAEALRLTAASHLERAAEIDAPVEASTKSGD